MTHRIDSQHLDVIVIGAGPAGGSAARELAKRGKKVLLIERSQEIGQPNYSTAATPKETMEIFSLPREIASASWDRVVFSTGAETVTWQFDEVKGYVLDFAKLRKFLAKDAAQGGAAIMVGTAVYDVVDDGILFAGVSYRGIGGEGFVRAKVIVDATGHYEFANSMFHFNEKLSGQFGEAIEFQMTGMPDHLRTTLTFYFGSRVIPSGYAWIFPMGDGREAKIGVGRHGLAPDMSPLLEMQREFIGFLKKLPSFASMEPTEVHAGGAYVDGGAKVQVVKNLLLVGDAARQINPVAGEGIRHALMAGRLAAEAIVESLKGEACDQRVLAASYQTKWKKQFSRPWLLSMIFCKFLYHELNDNGLRDFIRALQRVTSDDAFHIFLHYEFFRLLKYPSLVKFLAHHGKSLWRALRNA